MGGGVEYYLWVETLKDSRHAFPIGDIGNNGMVNLLGEFTFQFLMDFVDAVFATA